MHHHATRMHCRWAAWHRHRMKLRCAVALALALLSSTATANAPTLRASSPVLRVLKLSQQEVDLPHRDSAAEFVMLADFARRHHLAIRWVEVARSADLYPALLRGEGDLIAADLPPDLACIEEHHRFRIGGQVHRVPQLAMIEQIVCLFGEVEADFAGGAACRGVQRCRCCAYGRSGQSPVRALLT